MQLWIKMAFWCLKPYTITAIWGINIFKDIWDAARHLAGLNHTFVANSQERKFSDYENKMAHNLAQIQVRLKCIFFFFFLNLFRKEQFREKSLRLLKVWCKRLKKRKEKKHPPPQRDSSVCASEGVRKCSMWIPTPEATHSDRVPSITSLKSRKC